MADILGAIGQGLTGFAKGFQSGQAQRLQQRLVGLREKAAENQRAQQRFSNTQITVRGITDSNTTPAQRKILAQLYIEREEIPPDSPMAKQLTALMISADVKDRALSARVVQALHLKGEGAAAKVAALPAAARTDLLKQFFARKLPLSEGQKFAAGAATTRQKRGIQARKDAAKLLADAKAKSAGAAKFGTAVPRRINAKVTVPVIGGGTATLKAGTSITPTPIKGTNKFLALLPDGRRVIIGGASLGSATQRTLAITTATGGKIPLTPGARLAFRKQATTAALNLSALSSAMSKVARLPRGTTGFRGAAADFVASVVGQVSRESAEKMAKAISGGATPFQIRQVRNDFRRIIAQSVSTITGEQSGRISNIERVLTEKALGLISKAVSPEQIRAALFSATTAKLIEANRVSAEVGRPLPMQTKTEAGQLKTFGILTKRFRMTRREAIEAITELERFRQALSILGPK